MVVDNNIDDVKKVLSQFQHLQQLQQQLQSPGDVTRCHERCCCKKCLKLIAATESIGQSENDNGRIPSPSCENNASAPLKTFENITDHISGENIERAQSETCDNDAQNCENNVQIPSPTCGSNCHIPLHSSEDTDDCVSLLMCENDHFSSETSAYNGQIPSWNCEENNENISSLNRENNGCISSQNCSVEGTSGTQAATQESFSTVAEINAHIPSQNCQNNGRIPSENRLVERNNGTQTVAENNGHIPSAICQSNSEIEAQIPSPTSPVSHFHAAIRTPRQNDLSVSQTATTTTTTTTATTTTTPTSTCPTVGETKAQVPPSQLHVAGNNADTPLQRDLSVTTTTTGTTTKTSTSSGSDDINADIQLPSSRRLGSKCHPLCSCHRCLQLVNGDYSTVNSAPLLHSRTERGLSGE